jgi:hypothetical protein
MFNQAVTASQKRVGSFDSALVWLGVGWCAVALPMIATVIGSSYVECRLRPDWVPSNIAGTFFLCVILVGLLPTISLILQSAYPPARSASASLSKKVETLVNRRFQAVGLCEKAMIFLFPLFCILYLFFLFVSFDFGNGLAGCVSGPLILEGHEDRAVRFHKSLPSIVANEHLGGLVRLAWIAKTSQDKIMLQRFETTLIDILNDNTTPGGYSVQKSPESISETLNNLVIAKWDPYWATRSSIVKLVSISVPLAVLFFAFAFGCIRRNRTRALSKELEQLIRPEQPREIRFQALQDLTTILLYQGKAQKASETSEQLLKLAKNAP